MKMGGGAAIKIKDASLLCHPTVIGHLEAQAKRHGIAHQFEILTAGGTDSGAIHISRNGVPSGAISIVTRHLHSGAEMCALEDVESCIALAVAALEAEIAG